MKDGDFILVTKGSQHKKKNNNGLFHIVRPMKTFKKEMIYIWTKDYLMTVSTLN